ncbi:cobalamin-independent methionine synthase II family protein [Patescibacteria group bacterium]|nr:cobalamin-independent methionine synthase II family protein [Patescibacteria group bacterium]MBU1885784.1 cobalamin-independent methionine synthase II family protein [Patescibacteria group bacterium]
MKKNSKIIRSDVVGSMLRPQHLLKAQQLIKDKKISPAQFIKVEDRAVREAVTIQEKAGLDVVTDGEMRRPVFCHNFVKAVDGFKWDIAGNSVIWFDMNGKKIIDPVTVGVVSKIKKKHDISIDEFSFIRGITDKPIKVTIPSPTMMSYFFATGISDKVYSSPNKFLDEVTQILKESVAELERIGVEYIQIDAPEFGMLIDPVQQAWFEKKGFNPDNLVHAGIGMINEILSDFSGTKGLHVCRGNDKNRFMAKGGYDKIAQVVFGESKVDRLLLEYDSDRAGNFSPLQFVPDSKIVVLGLITTKSPKLEKEQEVIQRIEEATKFIPKERLAISTQCGFASVAKGNNLSFGDQAKKLALVSKIAQKVWKV